MKKTLQSASTSHGIAVIRFPTVSLFFEVLHIRLPFPPGNTCNFVSSMRDLASGVFASLAYGGEYHYEVRNQGFATLPEL